MNRIICVLLIVLMASCNQSPKDSAKENGKTDSLSATNSQRSDSSFLVKHPLLTLMRKNPVEIGCILQSEFNYRDSVFNCDYKNYVNKGDPCKNTTEYYEGIQVPANLIKKIDPSIKEIHLDFEHGSLREISITFDDSLHKDKIREIFNLPSQGSQLPDNVMNIDYGENTYSNDKPINPNYTRWLIITGFDHMGAGDVPCK